MNFEDIGLHVPTILLPKKGTDLNKWSVVACDQYTSQPEYWEKVKEYVGDSPSTLNLILPEVYLESDEEEQIIEDINANMIDYLNNGELVEQKPGFIALDRKTSQVESRKGLMVALDLEHYDFSEGSTTLIRATEGTIVDRLPPRIKVRENASIELPHIMVLIDDPDKKIIEPLFDMDLEKAYDLELMEDSGHLTGYHVNDPVMINMVAEGIRTLANKTNFNSKYGLDSEEVMVYAMGDGNHSLATAKAIWETMKKEVADESSIMDSPARYALVELVNIHDEGLEFEAIFRVVFDANKEKMFEAMREFYSAQGSIFSYKTCATIEEAKEIAKISSTDTNHISEFVAGDTYGVLFIENPKYTLETATIQTFIDDYLSKNTEAKVDYIHGEDVVCSLSEGKENFGFLLPSISKDTFFKTITVDGALPRKTFSMGEADEKRFYLECRKIK